jgi:Rod binding domain-containing protein
MQPLAPVASVPTASTGQDASDARLKQTAHQFEAMFMTEMLRQALPANKAAGRFAAGNAEGAWRVLMDQALGNAAATNGPAGDHSLDEAIQKALRQSQDHAANEAQTTPAPVLTDAAPSTR